GPLGRVSVEEEPAIAGGVRVRPGELVEGPIVELRRHFDDPGHGTAIPPRKLCIRPPAPRLVKFFAPQALASRMAVSTGASPSNRAQSVAPKASPQPVGSPSPGAGGAGIRAVWIGPAVARFAFPSPIGRGDRGEEK